MIDRPTPRRALIPRTPENDRRVRKLLDLYFRAFHFFKCYGADNVPKTGPLLLVSNHVSYYDPLVIALSLGEVVRFMTWDALFVGHPVFGGLISEWGAFPVDPDGADPGGFRACLAHLKQGERVVIFPEGGRSLTRELAPLREGAARLAMNADVPIVPVRIAGAQAAWPRGEGAPRPFFRIEVHYGEPIYPRHMGLGQARREESTRIMAILHDKLSNMDSREKPEE